MITDREAEASVNYLKKSAREYAEAKANSDYLKDYSKSILEVIAADSGESSATAKKSYALRNVVFIEYLSEAKEAVQTFERLKAMMVAAQAQIDVYRTQQANRRR